MVRPETGGEGLGEVIDNYATHKTPKVHRWLLRRPRFHLHFTPTGSFWLNMVERFFARITTEAIRRGGFSSVRQLQAAIDAYLAEVLPLLAVVDPTSFAVDAQLHQRAEAA